MLYMVAGICKGICLSGCSVRVYYISFRLSWMIFFLYTIDLVWNIWQGGVHIWWVHVTSSTTYKVFLKYSQHIGTYIMQLFMYSLQQTKIEINCKFVVVTTGYVICIFRIYIERNCIDFMNSIKRFKTVIL